ncbi:Fatty acid metabolism regulator protein [Haemophilus influenzae]|uniref:fatty acid metabolism transcriptional regulator FadR n=1 Tax=Haemophilus influenzae TaxID=727 RepID=UPI000CFEFE8D|nr:fatty acid metabolism transcriptional regulator FadR [Haemophilus influenzae]PRJ72472.1 Fatty acid metabolism regulator protein [Haemophilus influenzae]PRJ84216.1 Fatty acid metabolism regulator protein [Haemophilus influenzae]PRK77985.1 Fatty acid metabolism regulator protein [Haemophilus influenzae]PRL23764.1 Fatty acid metabolism regulator protein [Haemophilus influenzae]
MQNNNDILKAQSPAALAEEYIVKSIWQDVFPSGSNLPSERDLADKIGVTRTTLREVLQRLARDGWLTIQHGKPTKVNNIWDAAGPNIIETLIALDMQSAPLIIDNMLSLRSKMSESYIYEAVKNSPQKSTALFAELEQLQNTAQDYTEFDYQLFRQFTVVANKPFYRLIFNSLKGVYQRIGLLFFKEKKHRELTKQFYSEMQQICLEGNADAVVDCIRKHNLRSSTYWKAILERLPQNLSD